MLYLRVTYIKASPKAISRRTSYLRVRLEFLRYPQIIPAFFNRHEFGPPLNFTSASTCSWIGHPVSGLRHTTNSPYSDSLSLRLQCSNTLTSLHNVTRWPVLQKVHGRTSHASTACKHRVSGSISLPSRGSFHLSLTVLCAIGHQKVFSLGRWSSQLPTGFHVPRSTLEQPVGLRLSLTGLSPSMVGLSRPLQLDYLHHIWLSATPKTVVFGLGSSPFARRYLGNRFFFLLLRVLRCFSSPGIPSYHYVFMAG